MISKSSVPSSIVKVKVSVCCEFSRLYDCRSGLAGTVTMTTTKTMKKINGIGV